MEESIVLLKRESARLRELAQSCDYGLVQRMFLEVAEEMERLLKDLEHQAAQQTHSG